MSEGGCKTVCFACLLWSVVTDYGQHMTPSGRSLVLVTSTYHNPVFQPKQKERGLTIEAIVLN